MDTQLLLECYQTPTQEMFALCERLLGSPELAGSTYRYWPGTSSLCLVAHIDTVHEKQPTEVFHDNGCLWAEHGLGADDRSGIFAALSVAKNSRPHILITDGEERGGIGASDVSVLPCPKGINALIQLDRRHGNDCVYYGYNRHEFRQYIANYKYKEDYGSFSDISIVAPAWNLAAVNLSVGYYNEHTFSERQNLAELQSTIERVSAMVDNPPEQRLCYESKRQKKRRERRYYKRRMRRAMSPLLGLELGMQIDERTGAIADDWNDKYTDEDFAEAFDYYCRRDEIPF